MNRAQRTLITSLVMLIGGGALAWFAFQDRSERPLRELDEAGRKRLFLFGRDHVVEGTLKNKHLEMGFVQDSGGFRLTAPIAVAADQDAMRALIDHMAAIRFDAEVKDDATAEDLKTYGLDPPAITMTVKHQDGTVKTLYVGELDAPSGRYFITDQERKRIGAADGSFYWALDRDLYAYRSKRIFELPKDRISGVAAFKGGLPIWDLKRADKSWTVSADGKTVGADPFVVDRLLLLLTRDLKAEAIVTDALAPEDAKKYALDAPQFFLEVHDAAGPLIRARIGVTQAPPSADSGVRPADLQADAGGEEIRGPWVQIEGTRTVADVYDAFTDDLDKSLEDFRDHTIAEFEPDNIQKIDLWLANGEHGIVERISGSGESAKWSLTLPQTTPAKAYKIEALLLAFSRMRSDRVETDAPAPAKLREWKMDPPVARVVFHEASGKVAADISIGKKVDSEHLFISTAGTGRVDAIREQRLAILPKSLEDVVERGGS